jgi:hypothetical protein
MENCEKNYLYKKKLQLFIGNKKIITKKKKILLNTPNA